MQVPSLPCSSCWHQFLSSSHSSLPCACPRPGGHGEVAPGTALASSLPWVQRGSFTPYPAPTRTQGWEIRLWSSTGWSVIQREIYCILSQRLLEDEVMAAAACSKHERSLLPPPGNPLLALNLLLYVIKTTEKLSNSPPSC